MTENHRKIPFSSVSELKAAAFTFTVGKCFSSSLLIAISEKLLSMLNSSALIFLGPTSRMQLYKFPPYLSFLAFERVNGSRRLPLCQFKSEGRSVFLIQIETLQFTLARALMLQTMLILLTLIQVETLQVKSWDDLCISNDMSSDPFGRHAIASPV